MFKFQRPKKLTAADLGLPELPPVEPNPNPPRVAEIRNGVIVIETRQRRAK